MLWFKRFLTIITLSFLAACANVSVTPLATTDAVSLASVNIVPTSGRVGQLYTRQLQQKLHVNGAAAAEFDLISTISDSSSSTLSVQGTSSTLKKMTMSAQIQLIELETGAIVLEETLSAGATLGAVTSYFGQDESERNARSRLAQLLGSRVAQRVQLHFVTQSD